MARLWLTMAAAVQGAGASAAGAQQAPACLGDRVQLDGGVSQAWTQAAQGVCDALPTWQGVDPSARVRLTPSGHELILEVTTGDGRSALRRVHTPEELALSVEALITVPEAPSATVAPAERIAPQPASAPEATPRPLAYRILLAPSQPAPPKTPSTLPVEVGAALMCRLERAPSYVSAGADVYAAMHSGAWALGLQLRWSPLEELVSGAPVGFEMESVGGGFLLGRRVLEDSDTATDLLLQTTFLAENQSYLDAMNTEHIDTDADVRIGGATRLLVGAGQLRWTVTLSAELSPLRAQRPHHVASSLPALPSWGLGFGVGAAWVEP